MVDLLERMARDKPFLTFLGILIFGTIMMQFFNRADIYLYCLIAILGLIIADFVYRKRRANKLIGEMSERMKDYGKSDRAKV